MERVRVDPLPRVSPGLTWCPLPPRLLLVLVLLGLSCQVMEVGSACPSDVTMAAHACFTEFSREYQNVKHSPKLLCCGVDVETLRAFCSSYMRADSCIADLKAQCEDPTAIRQALTNLQGARAALRALCADDTVIERYARHQSCITQAGPTTLQCIRRHLNTSDNVRLLASIQTLEAMEFCRAMRGTMECVQRNVGRQCGQRASQLAAILVLPMVRYSTSCHLAVPDPPPRPPISDEPVTQQTQPAPTSHGGSRHGSRHVYEVTSVSGSSRLHSTLILISWTFVMRVLVPSS
ncbi:uncharacterized protein LOC143278125 [Babylonia areolata]|uniref:uncharacterized protein LOC143278125 n=1 Tax=Babylonia areolata TaxID=304850 RepID=UPI003FD4AB9E